MPCCHKFVWIHGRSPSHMLYIAFLPQMAFCFPLILPFCFPHTLPSFPFLSFLAIHLWYLSITLTLSVDWTVTKLVFSCHSKFHFCGVKLVFILHSAVLLRGMGKSNTSAIWRENTYGRTQNLYVLRDLACYSCSQHNWISQECLIHSCCRNKSKIFD